VSDASAGEAYNALVQLLRNNHLDWVAVQIEEEIILGKIKSERINVPVSVTYGGASGLIEKRTPESTKGEFVARVAYTEQEKFEIAIGAVEAVVLGAIKIQDNLAETLNAHEPNTQIHFVPGETGDVQYTYSLTELEGPRSKIEEIERYLRELRSDVQDDD
jgi:hypothetical protein